MLRNLIVITILLFFTGEVLSIPRFALQKGGNCIDCHVNPTGGNLRNTGGWKFGKNSLPLVSPHEEFKMSNSIADNIIFGLDFRGQYLAVFRDNSSKSDFQRMTGSIYSAVSISEEIDLFARYDFIWGIWEAYAVARILPNDSYLKAGSFSPNYGIRLDDHTAYTRGGDLGVITSAGQKKRGLLYGPQYIESGAEMGVYLSDFALLTASVGSSRSPQLFVTDPTYTTSLQINRSVGDINLLIGGSAAVFRVNALDASFNSIFPQAKMFGGFAGLSAGDFTVMGEYDIAQNYVSRDTSASAIMIEASYQIYKGVDAVVRYDRFDPSVDAADDDISRFVFGFEFHPYSFIEIKPQYRLQLENPSVKNDALVIQFHFWY